MRRCPICGLEVGPGALRCPRDGILLGETQDPLVGATLAGRYRVLSRLARGGMSSVYLARHVLIERLAAIKVLRRDLCDDPVQRDRFLREARAVNRINHENIVEIIDYGETEDGRVYLVMEYLPGESLQQRLARGAMAPSRALGIAIQIASGLARAHQMGVIHRDLKPDNVLLVTGEDGAERVKILDFGIAKLLDQPSLTATDKIFGTPGYIAPEYAAGAPIDGRADLYSLGVVLYEMVTAQLPFDVEYPSDLLLKHMLDPPIPPRQRNRDVPEQVERLILRALAKDPAQRYRDAYQMIDDLERTRASLRTRLETPPPVQRGGGGAVAGATVELPEPAGSPLSPPPESAGTGPLGAHAWARFLEALRATRGERSVEGPWSPEAQRRLDRMQAAVNEMRERSERIETLRSRTLSLESRGRDVRATIGRAIDALAEDLSARAGERDTLSAERDRLEKQREELRERGRQGDAEARGRADVLLWEIAACDEALRQAVGGCEDVEYQLRELGNQLERLSAALEADQNEIISDLNVSLAQLAELDRELRTLLAGLSR